MMEYWKNGNASLRAHHAIMSADASLSARLAPINKPIKINDINML
jgi:hypothetical protein